MQTNPLHYPCALLAFALAACAGNSAREGEPAENTSTAGPAYALVTLVWSNDGPTGYVALTDSLDVDAVPLDDAREFPGYTSIAAVDGRLLVNPSADDPTIERYRISNELAWKKTAALSFAKEGVEEVGFYRQYLQRERTAYIDVDVSGRVLWDPSDLSLLGTKTESTLALKRVGLDLFAANNRTYFVFSDEITRPFSYHDQDWFIWSPDSQLVVYDSKTHDAKAVIDAPCPGLDTISRDEEGNTYFGTWEYSALNPLMGTGAAPCVVRLKPNNTLDAEWTSDLRTMTDGRFAVNFRYLSEGKAIAAVLHAEEYGKDFDFTRYAESVDDFWATAGRYHRLWMFDLEAETAAPIKGIDEFDFINPGFFHSVIDGRTFVFLGDGSTNNPPKTVVYELDQKGTASRKFEVAGSVTQWIQLR